MLGNDYWANEFDPSTASTWAFEGADGLFRLSGPARYSAPVPVDFWARLVRAQLDHVALESFHASPHRGARTMELVKQFPTPVLTLVLVVEGSMRVDLPSSSFSLRSGQFIVVDSREPVTFTTDEEVRQIRSVVGLEHVPESLRASGATLSGPLERTPLAESFIAFASTVLRTTASGRRTRGDQLVQAVIDLQIAVHAEAQQVPHQPGQVGLRYRIEEHIEAHFRNPALNPSSIASSMGVSLRQVHLVFNDDERTIAAFIRDRRVAAVALELRSGPETASVTTLALRHGFTNPEALTRAFRQRFGMTPSNYRDGGHRTIG